MVKPDASLRTTMQVRDAERRINYLLEYEHRTSPASLAEKLRNYDALLSVWWRQIDAFWENKEGPVALLVVSDSKRLAELVAVADRELTCEISYVDGRSERRNAFPGRARTFFCLELDIHQRTTRALQLHAEPLERRLRTARGRRETSDDTPATSTTFMSPSGAGRCGKSLSIIQATAV